MNCPDTVGECIDQITEDAQEMAPYYQALGEPDDGTSAYLEEELWNAPWHGPNPGLPYHKVPTGLSESSLTIREYLEWGFSAEGYYGTDVDYWHDRDPKDMRGWLFKFDPLTK